MAYANLLNQTCNGGKAEFFCRLRDFICKRNGTYADYSTTGIGWTLYDSSYTVDENNPQINDWFVAHSDGESGREQMYLLFKWYSSTTFTNVGYLYWNNSTHLGTQIYANSTGGLAMADTASNPQLWIYGNLDSVFFVEATTTNGNNGFIGKLESAYESEDIGYCSGSITAGSDKSITVDIDLPTDWIVGAGVFIWDIEHVEKATIKTVNTGTKTITVDVSNSYTGTFRVSRFLGYVSTPGANIVLYTLCNKAGSTATTISAYIAYSIAQYVEQLDNTNKHILTPCYYSTTGGLYGKLRNIMQTSQITPLVHKDVFIDQDGNEWRYLHVSANKYIACKEI